MRESIVMTELRKIKEDNSLRYLSQTPEERTREYHRVLEWYSSAIGKPLSEIMYNPPK